MSVVIRESHATNDQPLWLGVNGGTIQGNLFVDGSIRAEGNVSTKVVIILDNNDNPVGGVYKRAVADGDGADGILLQGNEIQFGRLGTGLYNTKVTTSAGGSNLDVLSVGGNITATGSIIATGVIGGIGPVPFPAIANGAPQGITLSSGTPTRTQSFGLSSPYPIVANAEYDVQLTGFLTLLTGPAPVTGDAINVFVTVGSGVNGTVSQVFYPFDQAPKILQNINDTAPFNIRARICAPASPSANITATVTFSGNAATGNIGGTCTLLDVVRVG